MCVCVRVCALTIQHLAICGSWKTLSSSLWLQPENFVDRILVTVFNLWDLNRMWTFPRVPETWNKDAWHLKLYSIRNIVTQLYCENKKVKEVAKLINMCLLDHVNSRPAVTFHCTHSVQKLLVKRKLLITEKRNFMQQWANTYTCKYFTIHSFYTSCKFTCYKFTTVTKSL